MWEGRPIENGNGWPSFTAVPGACNSPVILSASSPKLCTNEDPSCSTVEKRRYSDCDNGKSPEEMLVPPVPDDINTTTNVSWQLLAVTLHRSPTVGFGIAVSGGRDNPHFTSGDPAVVVSDVIPSGPAWGLVQVNDRILFANGVSLENAEYAAAVKIMKESQHLNMIVKRRAPVPLMEFEQRTLKFTLTKSKKKEDFGIVLGCKFYIKEITNRKLAEKEPGLKEGDTILRINGQSVDGITIEEATKWLTRSREKLSLVIQRDVRTGTSRWPSQNTIYERLGSVTATPRHSPSPMHSVSHHYPPAQPSTAEFINNSSASNSRWSQSQSEQHSADYGDYCKRNGSIASSHGNGENEVRTIRFRKAGGSLGVRVIGGNHVGIFVSAVQEDSPAALNSIRPGDRILSVNGKSMIGVTREEVVRHLLSLNDDVTIGVEYAPLEFEQVRSKQLGDNFYIRTHFSHQKSNPLELTFHNGDIFLVTDTLFGGTVGLWQATRVYSSTESTASAAEPIKGVIPNAETAEKLAAASRTDMSTLGRSTFFRRKLKERRTKSLNKNVIDDFAFSEGNGDMALPAYERVTLRQPPFQRPVVLYGPLADVARQMLLTNFALRFASPGDDAIVRLSSIDAVISANKHCLLDVSPGSVERLQLAQYAPIVILIDVESRSRIRELRNKAGATSVSSRKLIEQAHKIKKHHSHILTAMLDATKEDGWFEALRQLIAHLQDRRVWMPEFRPSTNLNDVVLLPMQTFQNQSDSDVDSLKGEYSGSDYMTQKSLQKELDDSVFRSVYESSLGSNGNYTSRAHLNPTIGSSTGSLVGRYPPYNHKSSRYPTDLYGQFPARLPLQPNNQQQFLMNSPMHRLMAEGGGMPANLPWATLPRRFQHGSTSSSPALNTTTNLPQEGRPALPLQHQSADRSGSQSSPTRFRENFASPIRSSPVKPPSTFLENNSSSRHSVTSPAPMNPAQSKNSAEERASSEQSTAQGYYDVKQILAEQSAGYYGPDSTIEGSKAAQFESVSSPLRSRPLAPPGHSSPHPRPGLFYDHVTRSRWNGTGQGERRQPPLPAHMSSRPQLRSSPLAPPQATTAPIDSSIRYVDDSPVEYHQQAATSSGVSNNNRGEPVGIKPPRIIDVEDSQQGTSLQNETSSESNTDQKKKKLPDIPHPEGKAVRKEGEDTTVIEHVSDVVGPSGGTLSCPQTGVMLIIPEGAIKDGNHQEIYVKVCRANGSDSRPPLDESKGESLMSPLVMCGPQNLQFCKPVELRLPHSASNNGENWSFALKSGTGKQWEQITLDENTSSVVTDKFVSVKISHF